MSALFLLEMVFDAEEALPRNDNSAASPVATFLPPPQQSQFPLTLTFKSDDRARIAFFASRLNLSALVQ